MIRAVTVGGEYGSGRGEIAKAVAARFNWRLVDNCLIEDIANTAHFDPELCRRLDERTDPWFHRLRKALWHGGYEGVTTTTETEPDADAVAAVAQQVILEAAKQGSCVIVGRGGQCVLQDREDVLHVFVYGPRDERIERVRARPDRKEDPETLTDSWDRKRAAYIRRYYGQDWTNRHLYDLMLCSTMGEEAAVNAVAAVVAGCRG